MKKFIALLISACLMFTAVPVQAASRPAPPKTVKAVSGTYYSYWDAHRAELNKMGIFQGDGYDAEISWSPVSKAKGYKVTIYWCEDVYGPYTTTVNVKKLSNGKYQFTTKGSKDGTNLICNNTKTFITNRCVSKKKFTSSKLKFHVSGDGSCIYIKKVTVQSYKVVNGKKVYSKVKTKKPTW